MYPRRAAWLFVLAVSCTLDRAGLEGGSPSSSAGGDTTGAGALASSSVASGTSSSSDAGGSAASTASAGGVGGASGGAGATGGAPLECWGPGAVCCGGAACPIGTHECCFSDQSQATSGQCVLLGSCQDAWVSVTCDDTEDCAGGACCTTWTGAQHVGMQCTTVAACTPPRTLGAAGSYPMCNYPGGNCPPNMFCYQDYYLGAAGWGYCYY